MISICRTYRFEAAHHLPLLPDTHKCHRLHGHNYRVDVELGGQMAGGMVLEFGILDAYMATLLVPLDHRLLNDEIPNPTAENLAAYLHERLSICVIGDRVRRIRVYENDDSWAQIDVGSA